MSINLKERRLKTGKKLKQLMIEYYMEAKFYEGEKPIAWITSGGPVEILYAFGVIPIYPENHSAMIGASKEGGKLSAEAESRGFPPEICSYAKCDFGQVYTKGGPIGGLPKPDVLICANNICGTVIKWYEELARIFNVPLIMVDMPFLYNGMSDSIVDYVEAQLNEMIAQLEEILKTKFDYSRFEEVLLLAAEGIDLWKKVLYTATAHPAPLSCFDAFVHMLPIVSMRGTKKCNDYYKELLSELEERTQNKFGAIPEERIRLIWDNIPLWFEMKWLAERFAEHGAALVADTYTHAWSAPETALDPSRGLRALAEAYTAIYLNLPIERMLEHILRLVNDFDAQGVVMHSNRSCKPYSFGQYDIARMLKERGIPVLILDGDMTDERMFSREQATTRIEAFLEMFE